ncbi:hypothetical protein CKF96_03780 (plasmid) [Priestia filamentosa]|nr:hypothetical protein CKF96_03780 [Priestia filamentosa]
MYELIGDETLHQAFEKLTKKEQIIIHLVINNQMKQIEISKMLNESPQNIAKTKKRALEKLRSDLIEHKYKQRKGFN